MAQEKLIPIESKSGVTIYGRILNGKGKLGQFEVHSDFISDRGNVYGIYADAEKRMNILIGVKNN